MLCCHSTAPFFNLKTSLYTSFSFAFVLCCGIAVSTSVLGNTFLPSVISLLLNEEGDSCEVIPIDVGSTTLSRLDSECSSRGRSDDEGFNSRATYFSFSHLGGPLWIDAIARDPIPFDVVVYLRFAADGTGMQIGGEGVGFDNNSHEDFRSARLISPSLSAGEYTIEVTSLLEDLNGTFNLSVYGAQVTSSDTGVLNDTGILRSTDLVFNDSGDCDEFDLDGTQDCSQGPDRASVISSPNSINNADGIAGKSFLKVSANGQPTTSINYACLKDNTTGMMWEVKQASGLHTASDTYTYFNSNPDTNRGEEGEESGTAGFCFGKMTGEPATYCNTEAFVNRVNANTLCGYSDWRVASYFDMVSIANLGDAANINEPLLNAANGTYWTHYEPEATFDSALGEIDSADVDPASNHFVRLVRGGQ